MPCLKIKSIYTENREEFQLFETLIRRDYPTSNAREQIEKAIAIHPNNGIAPNGMSSNLNRMQWLIVRTEAFKDWFGDWENEQGCHCLDENGEPILLHHGGHGIESAEEFSDEYAGDNTGNNSHGGFHFVDSLDVAQDYGRQSFLRKYQDNPETMIADGIVSEEFMESDNAYDSYDLVHDEAEERIEWQSVFLKMDNPFIIDMEGRRVDISYLERLRGFIKSHIDENCEFFELIREVFIDSDIELFRNEICQYLDDYFAPEDDGKYSEESFKCAARDVLLDNGFEPELIYPDGIIIKNMVDDISDYSKIIADQYIVFNPNQIGFRQH